MTPPFTYTVAPLTVLPLKKTLFSYGYHENLSPGTLVTVPFAGRNIPGIIIKNIPPEETAHLKELKNILSIEGQLPLTKEQLILAQQVSEMTFTPFGKVLKHFVPKKAAVRKNQTKKAASLIPFPPCKEAASALKLLETEDEIFLPLSSHVKSLEILGTIIQERLTKETGQILVLAPDISTAVRLEQVWGNHFPSHSIAGLYHTKTPGQYFEAWQKIQSGEASLIIATRHGQFAPFKNLHTIIQLDPNDEAYKQWDMSPRYHTSYTVPLLQSIWGTKLIGVAPLPPLSVLKEKKPMLPLITPAITPTWVNLKIERWQKNWNVFSLPLQTAIKQTLADKKQIIVYSHQSGLESFSVCTECRTIFRCPSCNSTLKLTNTDHYQCKHCSFKSSLFPQCPQCKSIHFKSVGYGTEKVAREVGKLFPGATVTIADKKHLPHHRKIQEYLEKSEHKEPDILVTTASFLRFPPLSQVGLVAIIDADTLLNLPGYRKDEQFIELIERSKGLIEPKGALFVQTFHPESDIFQKITKSPSLALLTQLLEERRDLHYPPYYRALTLEARPKKKDGVRHLQSTTKKLKDYLTKHPDKKKLIVQSTTRMERGKSKPYTLLRYQPPLAADITDFLTNHADTIFIDHDPQNIT